MKRLLFFSAGLLLLLSACTTDPQATETTRSVPVGEAPTSSALAAPTASSTGSGDSPAQTVHSFLLWYGQHAEDLQAYPLVPAALDSIPTNQYTLDFQPVDAYLARLHQSGLLSPRFLQASRRYLQQCQDSLLAHPQTDGPPEGLQYDRILYTQLPEQQLQLLLRTQPTSLVAKDSAQVSYHWEEQEQSDGPDLTFSVMREQGTWKISAIRPSAQP